MSEGAGPKKPRRIQPLLALTSGGIAGFFVDTALFPLDTVKTRLQSTVGFRASGGFRQLYKGLPAIAIGAGPDAALFFMVYESSKNMLESTPIGGTPVAHFTSSTAAEIIACTVRVPMDQLKQRMQAGQYHTVSEAVRASWLHPHNGGFKSAYRAYIPTLSRDIPFSFLQFPVYEFLKEWFQEELQRPLLPYEGAACGSVAGAFAGGVTTPLDVCKTRVMLATPSKLGTPYMTFLGTLRTVYAEEGLRTLCAGGLARMSWMGMGAFVLFGSFETSVALLGRSTVFSSPPQMLI